MDILRYIVAIACTFAATFLGLRAKLLVAIPICLFLIFFTQFEYRQTNRPFARKLYMFIFWWSLILLLVLLVGIIVY